MAEVSQRREEKRRGQLLNKLLNNRLSIPVSFSVGPDNWPVLEKFFEIARREGGSRGRSHVFVNAMAEYNAKHGEGNPNLKIASYLPNAEKSPMRVLCWSLAGATTEGKVYCRKAGVTARTGGGAWISGIRCYSCKENQLRKKKEP